MNWTLESVAAVVGAVPVGRAAIDRVVIDSRDAGDGALFVGLPGTRVDGSAFAPEAAAAGAAVLVSRGSMPDGASGVEVDDPWRALFELAVARRDEIDVPVVAVTGSSGKTSTKDLLAAAMGPSTHASTRSFNNEAGVPITVLSTPDTATGLVCEVGSRGAGHIRALMPAIRPDVSVITNVGRAHLSEFGSVEGVLEAKWEIVEALEDGGVAVLPASDRRLVDRRQGALVTFGVGLPADVTAVDVQLDASGRVAGTLLHGDQRCAFRLASSGLHQAANLAAAVAAALAVGVPFELATTRAAEAVVSAWRMEVTDGPVTIVNDAYNANPDSMASALETVASLPGRHVAVLGRMHELGDYAEAAHREVGALARRLGFAEVVVVGDDPGIAAGAGDLATPVADVEEAHEVLRSMLGEGDVVVIKASRAEGLEVLAEQLVKEFAR